MFFLCFFRKLCLLSRVCFRKAILFSEDFQVMKSPQSCKKKTYISQGFMCTTTFYRGVEKMYRLSQKLCFQSRSCSVIKTCESLTQGASGGVKIGQMMLGPVSEAERERILEHVSWVIRLQRVLRLPQTRSKLTAAL